MVLQVVVDGQYRDDGERLVRHRRQQHDPVHRYRGREQQVFRHVQRFARDGALHLTAKPKDKQHDRGGEQNLCETICRAVQHRGNARHCFAVARDEVHERVVERKQQQQPIERIIEVREIAVLLFVKHHEAVVLLDEVVIRPQRCHEQKHEPKPGEHQHWSNCEEQQRSPQKTRAIMSLSPIEISA